jgi:hypothetical protein
VALPPIIIPEDEPIRLVSPWDEAVDRDATPDDAMSAYESADAPDVSTLVLRQGEEPTWLTVRALTAREMRVVRGLYGLDGTAPKQDQVLGFTELMLQLVRFGLVGAEGWPGFDALKKERLHVGGLHVWPDILLDVMPSELAFWVGMVVWNISTVSEKKSIPSGSSPGQPVGISEPKTPGQSDETAAVPSANAVTPALSVARAAG